MANSADPGQLTDLDLHCFAKQSISEFSLGSVGGGDFYIWHSTDVRAE